MPLTSEAEPRETSGPEVSVLLATHNDEKYITHALQSVLDQAYGNFEIVIVDDGSTDETPAIVSCFVGMDPRCRVFRNDQNLGLTASLNIGLGHCRGRFVARLDADDVCCPNRLREQVAFLADHPDIALVGCGCVRLDATGEASGIVPSQLQEGDVTALVGKLLDRFINPLRHSSLMARTICLRALEGYHPAMTMRQDMDLFFRLLESGMRIGYLPAAHIGLRVHGESLSNKRKDADAYSFVAALASVGRRLHVDVDYPTLVGRVSESPEVFRYASWRNFRLSARMVRRFRQAEPSLTERARSLCVLIWRAAMQPFVLRISLPAELLRCLATRMYGTAEWPLLGAESRASTRGRFFPWISDRTGAVGGSDGSGPSEQRSARTGATSAEGERVVRFVNLFEPVVPLYTDLGRALGERGVRLRALMSTSQYREHHDRQTTTFEVEPVRQPRWFPAGKRWAAIWYLLATPFRLLRRASLTIFLTQPPMFLVPGALICLLRRQSYAVHVMDVFPDLFTVMGWIRRGGLLFRMLDAAMNACLRRAEFVVVIGRCMRDRLAERSVKLDRIRVIPNWAHHPPTAEDIREFGQAERAFRERHKLGDRFLVLYSGNMGWAHRFDTVLRVAERLRDRPEIVFVFVGSGTRRGEVEAAVRRGNIRLLPPQPLSDLPAMLRAADIHYICLREGLEGCVVPSKLYGALASGRAILYEGNADGEIARVVREERCGAVIAPGDAESMLDALTKRLASDKIIRAEGQRAKETYRKRYHPSIACASYVRLILDTLENSQMVSSGEGA